MSCEEEGKARAARAFFMGELHAWEELQKLADLKGNIPNWVRHECVERIKRIEFLLGDKI